jgi:hypothetical protein
MYNPGEEGRSAIEKNATTVKNGGCDPIHDGIVTTKDGTSFMKSMASNEDSMGGQPKGRGSSKD